MAVLNERITIRVSSEDFVFDKPQKQKSRIVRTVLDYIEELEEAYMLNIDDDKVDRLRKKLFKMLDSLHLMILNGE